MPPAHVPRFDLYGPVHKALRAQLCDTLLRCGRLDVADATELQHTCEQVAALLAGLRSHLAHEEAFIHPVLEAIAPGSAGPVNGEHDDHRELIAEIELLVANLRAAPSARVATTLYRRLALLVADNLEHMEVEESRLHEQLWSHFSDEQLGQLNGRIVAHVSPAEFAGLLAWMLPALTPAQRTGMLADMRLQAPAPVFEMVVGLAQTHLDAGGWLKLARSLGLPAVREVAAA